MTHPSNQQLRQFIMASFSDADLDTFCFDYFFDVYDNFAAGMRKNDKVLDVIGYCRRREMMPNLLTNLEKERKAQFHESFASPKKTTNFTRPPKVQPRNPKQVFISYATKDAANVANQLAADLRASGFFVWIAPTSIQPGEKWADAIERGLQESGIFLLLLSPAAADSYWVKKEMDIAMLLEGRGKMRILPLDMQPCNMPLRWEVYQLVLFRGTYERGWTRLQRALDDSPLEQAKLAPSKPIKPPAGRMPSPPKQKLNSFIHEKTGLEFVRIPAGEFMYGDKLETRTLLEYWISKTPVTHAVYQRFIDANPNYYVPYRDAGWAKSYNWNKKKRAFPADKSDHPVLLVTWHDAIAFCKWAGLQLPTEEEWEKAARGADGRKYPWGNNKPTDKLCNFNNNVKSTTPVGRYSPQGDSTYGCVDMSGNVWEWCLNKYKTPTITTIDGSGDARSLRGGAFYYHIQGTCAAFRDFNYPHSRLNYVGFRVAEHLSDSVF